MKFCIISDIHCSKDKGGTNLFYANIPDKPVSQNPLTSFLKIISEDEEVNSDMILCLGDLGHQAYDQGIKTAWDSLERIKSEMNCNLMVGVPGNHDIDSRQVYDSDPFNFIKNFSLNFPTPDRTLNRMFWSEGYCIYETDDCEILMINTVHNHKDVSSAKTSLINDVMLDGIRDDLKIDLDKIKICMLHHHPIKHSDISNWNDTDSIEKGDELISLLNSFNYDIVIHGHKHQPRICEISGLTIFATGSFSCFENLQSTGISTMFHTLEIEKNGKGKIFSWEFNLKKGWAKNLNYHFPPEIGFGGSIDINLVAKQIAEKFESNENRPILYVDILNLIPELNHIIPEKLIRLGNVLESRYALFMSPGFPLKPTIITSK